MKKSKGLLTPKEKTTLNKLWLDEFAFIEIGTLLNSSPKTNLIKVWKSKLTEIEVENGSYYSIVQNGKIYVF